MSTDDPAAQIEEIAQLMRQELRAGGTTFDDALRQCRRQLPRKLRRDADLLARAEPFSQHPKLRLQLDHARIAQAHARLRAHLRRAGAGRRRVDLLLSVLGSLALGALMLLALWAAVLVLRGG